MMRNIPDSMSFPFTVWMCENGGITHLIKMDSLF